MSSSSPSSAPTIPDELTYLITAFLPSAALDSKSKAFLVLSSYCQGVRSSAKTPADATIQLSRIFSRSVIPAIGDTDEQVLLSGITFLTALFEVDWESASSIFQEEGVAQVVLDSVDLTPSPELALSVALLLSHVSARKSCRAILPSETVPWLQAQSGSSKPKALRVAASIALLKLSRGSAEDTATSSTGEPAASSFALSEPQLAQTMAELLVSDSGDMGLGDPVEALAYLSTNPKVKDYLSRHKAFLERLFTLAPRRKASSPSASTQYYGILVIVANIVSYRVRLSQEQQQMDKLKSMAKPMGGGKTRGRTFGGRRRGQVSVPTLSLCRSIGSVPRSFILITLVQVYERWPLKHSLPIVEDSNNRGKVLQAGGAKVLITIIRQLIPASKAIQQTIQFEAVQALAKLAITASPVQVFGPNETALYDYYSPVLYHGSTFIIYFASVI
ncbi:hypothetical protein DL96DRAFT_65871 [Flagelloscypha sp. PMI_526]|nr:hypothetical protein DL96DRAFT_65871 [Flagelloscypha sp. PMI_526]